MPILPAALVFSLLLAPAALFAQEAAPAASAPAAVPVARTASSILQPALSQTQETLATLKVDKWKRGSVRDEAGQNVSALLHDLQANIPPLLSAADAEPSALSRAMPLIKHLDALYDVLLRVEEASRISAPGEQITALQATLLAVNQARIAYDDELQNQAAAHEKLVFDLRAEVQTQTQAAEKSARDLKAAEAKAAECKPAAKAKPSHRRKRSTTTKKPSPAKPSAAKPSPATPQPH